MFSQRDMYMRKGAATVILCALASISCAAPASTPSAASAPSGNVGGSNADSASSWVVARVYNAANDRPIPAITLTMYFQEIGGAPRKPLKGGSNSEGVLVFGPVTSGLYCILATSFGYHPAVREFTLNRGKRDTVNIVLQQKSATVSMQQCLPARESIAMCPEHPDSVRRRTDNTRCPGQP